MMLLHTPGAAIGALLVLLVAPVSAQRASRPAPLAIRNVRLNDAPDAPRTTLILRDGSIEAVVDASAEPPADARVIDAHGLLGFPAFLDAYAFAGCVTPQPVSDRDIPPKTNADVLVDMRQANRKGIQPAFQAANAFHVERATLEAYRAAGFGAFATTPHGQLLSGSSALVTTREVAARDAYVRAIQFDTLGLDCTGSGYPSTPMGALAQLRQFFLDARWHADLLARRSAGRPGARPPFDEDLAAIQPALRGERRVVCEAETANDLERCVSLGAEFGFSVAIAGGREAWKRAPILAGRKIPVFLTLEWGDEPDDPRAKDKKDAKKPDEPKVDEKTSAGDKESKSTEDKAGEAKPASKKADSDPWRYEEPLRVREERRRVWEESRDCAHRLSESGVEFALGCGRNSPKELVERARALVENGLPVDVALRALTSSSARLLGVADRLGSIERGFDATFAIWTRNPLLSKDAKLVWLVVDGFLFPFDLEDNEVIGKPDAGVDATGTWVLEFDSPESRPATATLQMDRDGKVKGSIRFQNPADASEATGDFTGQVAGKKLKLSGRVKIGGFEADVSIEGEIADDGLRGDATWKSSSGEFSRKFRGQPAPKQEER